MPLLLGESLDPKCMNAFDTVMSSCDGRDFGDRADQSDDDGDYANAGQDDSNDADGVQDDDGFQMAAYSI